MPLQETASSQYFGGTKNTKNSEFIGQHSVMAAFLERNESLSFVCY